MKTEITDEQQLFSTANNSCRCWASENERVEML